MGQIIPISCVPVLPGDTVQHATSAMMRLSPLNTPVMHPTSVRVHHFYVPNRIVNPDWEDFITGGPDGTSVPAIPQVQLPSTKGTVADHLYGALGGGGVVNVNAMPLAAFNRIFNEYYRDQDLVAVRTDDDTTIPNCAWEKDYFGIARPFTQKGPDVSIPLAGSAPVTFDGLEGSAFTMQGADPSIAEPRNIDTSGATATIAAAPSPGLGALAYADLSGASAANVNDFRTAFSLQRYQEARARYGSRFTEYLRYLGITPSDARLQRPEYLGGGQTRVNFSEVLQTVPDLVNDPTVGVGDLYGHGIAGVRSNRYRKFFEEHGYVITCMSVRPKALYVNGIPREHLKTTKEDYFQKELANLGQQEVLNNELFANFTTGGDVFGYTDRYQEYRGQPSQISGDFRDTLNAWHMGRDLESGVALNESFVTCDPSDRIFQVGEATSNTLWCFINHKMVARRIVPKRANPRIL